MGRILGSGGKAGPWFAMQVLTPKAPMLFVFGDSIAAGHHRDSEGAPTVCQDETYSYGQTAWDSLEAQVPVQ